MTEPDTIDSGRAAQAATLQHPRAIRWMHWINFPLLMIMIWSGLRIYTAEDVYAIGIGSWQWFAFFPNWLYEALDPGWLHEALKIDRRLARGMAFHFSFGWLFVINGAAYLTYLAVSREWRHIVPDRHSVNEAAQVIAHDLGLRDEAPPQGRYNAAQRLAYTAVLVMAVLIVLSGFAIYKPTTLHPLPLLFGGYQGARLVHFTMTIGLILFFVVHIAQVARAGWNNFRSMVTGYVVHDAADDAAPSIGLAEHGRRSRRSFLTGALGAAGLAGLWTWVQRQPARDNIPGVLRDVHEANEAIWKQFDDRRAREYSLHRATPIRVNGVIGLGNDFDPADWSVRVEGPDGELLDELGIDFFQALPQHELVYEHKCIEGWSNITHWGGPRFSDFHTRFADRVGDVPYVYLETVPGTSASGDSSNRRLPYYVGWDIDTILHPQTLLALRTHGEPLDLAHGAPLRLATPKKYGIKTIKRIGLIRYTHERPPDYWAERGYDWYTGI